MFRDNFSSVRVNAGFILFDFRLWSEFSLKEETYQLIWTPEIGMFIVNNQGVIVAKFNSNFVPLVFDNNMKYTGDPKTYMRRGNEGETEVIYIPILQAGQDEFGTGDDSRSVVRPLNIALLSVWIANDTVEVGIANDQMLIAGEQLTYYDGERITEQGFAERPRIGITSNPNPFIRNTIDIPITTDTETVEEKELNYTQRKETGFHYNAEPFKITMAQEADDENMPTSIVGWRTSSMLGSLTKDTDPELSLYNFESSAPVKSGVNVTDIFFDTSEEYIAVQLSKPAKIGGFSFKRVTEDGSGQLACIIFHESIDVDGKETYVFYTGTNLFAHNQEYEITILPIEKYNSATAIGEFNEQIELTNANYIDVIDYSRQEASRDLLSSTFDFRELDFINNVRRIGVGNVYVTRTTPSVSDTQTANLPRFRAIETGDNSTEIRSSNYNSGQGRILNRVPNINPSDLISSISSFEAEFEVLSLQTTRTQTTTRIPDLTVRTAITLFGNRYGDVTSPLNTFQKGSTVSPIPQNDFFSRMVRLSFVEREETITPGTPSGTRTQNGLVVVFQQRGPHVSFYVSPDSNGSGSLVGSLSSNLFYTTSNNLEISFTATIDDEVRRVNSRTTTDLIERLEFSASLNRSFSPNNISYPLRLYVYPLGTSRDDSVLMMKYSSEFNRSIDFTNAWRRNFRTLPTSRDQTITALSYLLHNSSSRLHGFPNDEHTRTFVTFTGRFTRAAEKGTEMVIEPSENWLQTSLTTPSVAAVTQNKIFFEADFETKQSYQNAETFLDSFAPTGQIAFTFATHTTRRTSSNTFTFSSSRSEINDNSDPNGPKVTYSNRFVRFSMTPLSSSSTGRFLSSFSGKRVQVIPVNMFVVKRDGTSGFVFPGREASSSSTRTTLPNLKSDNVNLTLVLNTKSSYSDLNSFYRAANESSSTNPPQIFLNNINLSFLNSGRDHSISGTTLTLKYIIPGNSVSQSIQNRFLNLLNSGPDFTLDIRGNNGSLFTTSVTNTSPERRFTRLENFPGLSGQQV